MIHDYFFQPSPIPLPWPGSPSFVGDRISVFVACVCLLTRPYQCCGCEWCTLARSAGYLSPLARWDMPFADLAAGHVNEHANCKVM